VRDLAATTRSKVLLTSRRDEQAWLGDLPHRVDLSGMPMLERLELARAIAGRQPGGGDRFLEVADWRPLLAFTQGNPLTITILVRQAIRDHRTTRDQIQHFVAELRAGAAEVTDDAAQGRDASLAASLDYGFTGAFTDDERAVLALLALFQGFADVDVLRWMGDPDLPGGPVPAVAGLDREAGIALLDRAADVGLLTAYGGGHYAVHPAIPWHLQHLFTQHYGPPGSPPALQAIWAWTTAISDLGHDYHWEREAGHAEVTDILGLEEANLLRARHLALAHHWHDLTIGPMQGLRALYEHTGRAIEWQRLVEGLIPGLVHPATAGPLPGREQQWAFLTSYQVRIAWEARDWATAQQLQNAAIAWYREQAAAALTTPPEKLDGQQRDQIRAVAVALLELGQILRERGDPGCIRPYQEATRLFQRIGDRLREGTVAFYLGNAYAAIPGLCDLDQAEHWYQHAAELCEEHRAAVIGELGNIAHARFRNAQDAGAPEEQLVRHLNDAADAYHQKLDLTPADLVYEHAVAHHALGTIYGDAGDTGRALQHHQQAIHYRERQDDRYGAGWVRYDTAVMLARAGRSDDALLYAQAALRDFEAVGPGATARTDAARQLITHLEQEPADELDRESGRPA
jgi:tetratricopeptide (TPR) repeat protein